MKKGLCLCLVLVLSLATVAAAHDTWVGKDADGLVVLRGHDGQGGDPYKPEYVKEAKAFDANGKEQAISIKPAENKAILPTAPEPALVAIVYNSGGLGQDAGGVEKTSPSGRPKISSNLPKGLPTAKTSSNGTTPLPNPSVPKWRSCPSRTLCH